MKTFQLGDTENQLLHSIYAAALTPEKWQLVLCDIVAYIGVDFGQLVFADGRSPRRNFIESARANNQVLPSEVADTFDSNRIRSLVAGLIEGTVIERQELIACLDEDAVAMLLADIKVVIPLINNPGAVASLEFHSCAADFQLSADTLQFLQRLAPHIARAMHIYHQISAAQHVNYSLIESLKCSNLCVLLLDSERRVIFSTAEAKLLLEKNPTLTLNRYNQLVIKDAKQQLQLEHNLEQLLINPCQLSSRAVDGEGADVDGVMKFSLPLHLPERNHPLKLTGVLLAQGQSCVVSAHVAIFISDPERQRQVPQEYLQQAFGLTRTEVSIAQLLLSGLGVGEIAAKRRTTLETARWQIKSIMHKTRTNNQAELVRLLMLLSYEWLGKPLVIEHVQTDTSHLGGA